MATSLVCYKYVVMFLKHASRNTSNTRRKCSPVSCGSVCPSPAAGCSLAWGKPWPRSYAAVGSGSWPPELPVCTWTQRNSAEVFTALWISSVCVSASHSAVSDTWERANREREWESERGEQRVGREGIDFVAADTANCFKKIISTASKQTVSHARAEHFKIAVKWRPQAESQDVLPSLLPLSHTH